MILVSFIIPTLNAGKAISLCLRSIFKQTIKDYEIIIADGGSTDNTLTIVNKYQAKIVSNPLKTAEAGKAVALRHARGKYLALIDSDNILPTKNWLHKMLLPFQDKSIICSEPVRFTYRRSAGFIERYSALLGANDPYAWFVGVYDRYSYLSNNWTGLKLNQIDKQKYIKIKLIPGQPIPTIGANGTIFCADFLKKNFSGYYLFDIDIISSLSQPVYIAKVKIGIIHTYCESSIFKFACKQHRRLNDMYSFQKIRRYNWRQKIDFLSLVKSNFRFALYSLFFVPALIGSIKGYLKKPDSAWFFHPVACFLSFIIYTKVSVLYFLGYHHPLSRHSWSQ